MISYALTRPGKTCCRRSTSSGSEASLRYTGTTTDNLQSRTGIARTILQDLAKPAPVFCGSGQAAYGQNAGTRAISRRLEAQLALGPGEPAQGRVQRGERHPQRLLHDGDALGGVGQLPG